MSLGLQPLPSRIPPLLSGPFSPFPFPVEPGPVPLPSLPRPPTFSSPSASPPPLQPAAAHRRPSLSDVSVLGFMFLLLSFRYGSFLPTLPAVSGHKEHSCDPGHSQQKVLQGGLLEASTGGVAHQASHSLCLGPDHSQWLQPQRGTRGTPRGD